MWVTLAPSYEDQKEKIQKVMPIFIQKYVQKNA